MDAIDKGKNIKAVFFDIDGTLFSHTLKKIPDSTIESLHLLREKGILTFLATGRGMDEIEIMPVGRLPFDGYVTMNGHMCYDREKNLLHSIVMDEEDCRIFIKLFQEKTLPICIVEKERMYLNFVNDTVERIYADITTEVVPVGEYQGGDIYQFVVFDNPKEWEQWMTGTKKSKIHFWHPMAADILHSDSGKAASIGIILPFYELTKDEIMVIGDGENDIDMIEYAGIGVAMGNAEEIVKIHADYVTEHIDEDGLKHALEHYGLI